VKIFGSPLLEAFDELQKIAMAMPEMTHYHLLMRFVDASAGLGTLGEGDMPYPGVTDIPRKMTHPLISKSGHTLGDYDFFFEWGDNPTSNEMRQLISKIDQSFAKLGCKYTLTTK